MSYKEQQSQQSDINSRASFETHAFYQETPNLGHNQSFAINLLDMSRFLQLEFARKKKPTGRKTERRKVKLPNQIRHEQNAAISVGTWKKRPQTKTIQDVH